MNDADLIRSMRAGDPEALAVVFDREAPIALALALRIIGDRRRAEDIVHDAFLAMWNHSGQLDGADVREWICDRVRRIGVGRVGERPPAVTGRRLLLIEPDGEVADTFRDFLVDLEFEVTVHAAVRPWWPEATSWDVVVLNIAGERSTGVMTALRSLRSTPETADALVVCGGWTEDLAPVSDRLSVHPGALDLERLGDVLRRS